MSTDRRQPETQFLNDDDWYVCRLCTLQESATSNLQRVIAAENWIHNNCETGTAFKYGGTFYFKRQEDHLQFSLMWG